jgi:hypothetical protein
VTKDVAGDGAPDITPIYPRPDNSAIQKAVSEFLWITEHIVPGSGVMATLLLRAMIHRGATVAEAMWALTDLHRAGRLETFDFRQGVKVDNWVTDDNPPAGVQVAGGILHVSGPSDDTWPYLCFVIDHSKLGRHVDGVTSAQRKPTARESTILTAIGEEELTGPEIAKEAGFNNNSRFRETLSTMCRLGLLKRGEYGYFAASRDMSRDEE